MAYVIPHDEIITLCRQGIGVDTLVALPLDIYNIQSVGGFRRQSRLLFRSVLQQLQNPGVHVLTVLAPSHARGLQYVPVSRFVALFRHRRESFYVTVEVALSADLHFRVELVVVEPNEAVRE